MTSMQRACRSCRRDKEFYYEVYLEESYAILRSHEYSHYLFTENRSHSAQSVKSSYSEVFCKACERGVNTIFRGPINSVPL